MNIIECNFVERTDAHSILRDQIKFRLNEINKIKDYFNSEIQERKLMSKKISKYIAAFDYFDKALIVLCFICKKWRNRYHLFRKCYWNSCRNCKCKFFSLIFCLTAGIIKKQELKIKKHNKFAMLAKSNLEDIKMMKRRDELNKN